MPNGHLSPPTIYNPMNQIMTSDSESDLSEAIDAPNTASSSSPIPDAENSVNGIYKADTSESSHDEDAVGSDDADFELDNSPPPALQQPTRHTRSSSETSSRLGKRKASGEDDDFMLADPELYGLRRSGRARHSRRVVNTPFLASQVHMLKVSKVDSDSDASGSDIDKAPRKRRRTTYSNQGSKQATPSGLSPSDSESELTSSRRSRPRSSTNKRTQRRLLQAAVAKPTMHPDVRFSTRQAAKVSNYNEDDDDMFNDEDDMQYEWVDAPDGNIPQVDIILQHRLREDTSKEASDLDKQDFEYYVKWQGKAHYHATWESYGSLLEHKGQRKAENYFKKSILEDLELERDEDMSPDEKEQRLLARESNTSEVEDYTKVERVISMRDDDDGGIEYYIKWKRIPYVGCTWEKAELISTIAQAEVDRFINRAASLPVSGKPKAPAEQFKEQPHYVKNGTLRDFQKTGINFMALNWQKGRSVILADEMGLGKTVQTVSFMNWLRHDRLQQGPFLVVIPLSTLPSWAETFDYWTPDINYVIYNGKEPSRNIIKDYELFADGSIRKPKFHVLLTTYEYVSMDSAFLSQIRWQLLVVDEAHRLKSRTSQLYQKLLDFKTPHRLLITGTPIQNDSSELAALLHFLNPGDVEADVNIDLRESDEVTRGKAEALINILAPIMIRRTKRTVEQDLPPKKEFIMRTGMADVQAELYTNILTRNYAALNQGENGQKQSLLNIMMELKKTSNHPFLLPNAEARIVGEKTSHEDLLNTLVNSSGKMIILNKLLKKLQENGHRVLIFSQMVKMLDLLQDYMKLKGYQYQRLDGTVPSVQRTQAMEHFNKPDSPDFCFLLSTRAGGLGINLMTADTVILFDSDWNPQADMQAMARAHRIGQTKPVTVYRLVTGDTVEEEVLERQKNKILLEQITIDISVTDKIAHEKLEKARKVTEAPTTSEDIARILKYRSQKMFQKASDQKHLEELDIDTMIANAEENSTEQLNREDFLKRFEYTDIALDKEWDEIIPKEALAKIKAEEEKKAHQKFLEDQIRENAPRKRKLEGSDREERAAKKRARDMTVNEAASESDVAEGKDPKRPLVTREIRDLIRAYMRYGHIDDERADDLVKEARLSNRDRGVLRSELNEIIKIATQLKAEEEAKIKEREQAIGKLIPQKEKKSVVFEYKGTARNNAYTIQERGGHMRLLRQAVRQVSDQKSFRIPEAQKGAETFTCEWGAREDGMLCVGVVRHGYGAWPQIRDDPDLGLADKFFLEEQRVERKEQRKKGEQQGVKTPQAVHLVRRMGYLLSVLEDKMSNNPAAKRAVENHHRNNKKNGLHARSNSRTLASTSPAPSSGHRRQREGDRDRHRVRHSTDRRISNGETNGHTVNGHITRPRSESQRHHKGSSSKTQTSSGKGADRTTAAPYIKLLMNPVNENLELLQAATKANQPDKKERAATLRTQLQHVGDLVMNNVNMVDKYDVKMEMETEFWNHVMEFWPNPGTKSSQVRSMYRRLKGIPEDDEERRVKAQDEADKARREVQAASSTTNGQVNGVSVRAE
ncbi:MAG: hypothetical protein L6R38_005581 [Xanthoria sp. 2 TBL-2021]|nr:MAG: hypothetical protein L6R38_005581 [Xanthoria sp. 2 TBL-2021]